MLQPTHLAILFPGFSIHFQAYRAGALHGTLFGAQGAAFLGDAHNTHIITGKDAAIHIDANNNVKISGSKHTTHATKVREQLNQQNKTKSKK